MIFDHVREVDHGLQARADSAGDPAPQIRAGLVAVEFVELFEAQCPVVRAACLQRESEQSVEAAALLLVEVRGPLEPQVARALRRLAMLQALGLANLVNGGVELRLHVVAVERDFGLLELLKHPEEVRLAHVLADLADLVGMAAMRAEVQREPLNSRGVPTGCGKHATPLIEIGEQPR